MAAESRNRAPHENKKLQFCNNHIIKRAIIENISPLDDGEKDVLCIGKKNLKHYITLTKVASP